MNYRIIMGIFASLAAGACVAYSTKEVRKPAEGFGKGFSWISAEGEAEPEPLPMFYEGDRVHIFEPYSGALVSDGETAVGPTLYEIESVQYDVEDEVFRYKLEGEDEWVSEDWLSLPFYSEFKKEMSDVAAEVLSVKKDELEFAIIGKAMDDFAKGAEIDRLLDVMNEGSAEERAEALEKLRKISN